MKPASEIMTASEKKLYDWSIAIGRYEDMHKRLKLLVKLRDKAYAESFSDYPKYDQAVIAFKGALKKIEDAWPDKDWSKYEKLA